MADENTAVAPQGDGSNPFAPPAAAPVVQEQAPPAQEQVPAQEAPKSELVTPPETTVDKVDSEPFEDGRVEYTPTGDAGLDVALTFIGNLGIAGTDPAVVQAANGNFSLLEAKLATMGDKARGWQQMMALAKDAYGRANEKYKAHIEGVDKAIMAVAGSADNWNAIKVWAAENATPEEKAEINRMIDAGPVQARAAATLLLGAYEKAKGTVKNPVNALRKNAGGESPTSENTRLSPRDYSAEVRKLHNKLGTRMETSPEYAELKRRIAR